MGNFLNRITAWLSWLIGGFALETSYVARIYADSLRDNFVSYTPVNQAKFDALKDEFDLEVVKKRPYLANLLRIEAALLETMPDPMVLARFWAVNDRFQRVVPLGTRQTYAMSVPAAGDAIWQQADFVRNQTRTLVDVIHANYLVNIGREQSIKRLKIMMVMLLMFVTVASAIFMSVIKSPLLHGLNMLWLMGVIGAILSITNRLQSAVSRDAMTEDGIYELTGLRVGWVGILTSIMAGGSFALVLYFVVMGGVLNDAYPVTTDRTSPVAEAPEIVADTQPAASPADGASEPSAEPPVDAVAEPAPVVAAPPAVSPETVDNCVTGDEPACAGVGTQLARALGLKDRMNFFKMLILAFLAGFAERLVPDILSRLSKRQQV